jgi:xylan 1,4-beta-xylosidase
MKMPEKLSAAQLAQLQGLTRDVAERDVIVTVPKSGSLNIEAPMRTNDILLMRLERIRR